jgi:uncharacterized protein YegL
MVRCFQLSERELTRRRQEHGAKPTYIPWVITIDDSLPEDQRQGQVTYYLMNGAVDEVTTFGGTLRELLNTVERGDWAERGAVRAFWGTERLF